MYVISCWLHPEIHYLGFIRNIEGSLGKREGESQRKIGIHSPGVFVALGFSFCWDSGSQLVTHPWRKWQVCVVLHTKNEEGNI
jgi:hypothetical protein